MPELPDHPIAYTALQPGTPVQTSDGIPFATVRAVLVDDKVAVFDGIVVHTVEGTRFVDADGLPRSNQLSPDRHFPRSRRRALRRPMGQP